MTWWNSLYLAWPSAKKYNVVVMENTIPSCVRCCAKKNFLICYVHKKKYFLFILGKNLWLTRNQKKGRSWNFKSKKNCFCYLMEKLTGFASTYNADYTDRCSWIRTELSKFSYRNDSISFVTKMLSLSFW